MEDYDVMVNVLPGKGVGRVEFALPNPIRRQDPRWISIRQVLSTEKVEDLSRLAHEIVQRVCNDPAQNYELFLEAHGHIQALWQIRERIIPIIKISHELEDVAEIFARLNQEGTRIKEADVILALAAARNRGWVRNEYLPFRGELEEYGWDLDAGIFVRTMTGIGKGQTRLKEVPKDFWNPQNLPMVWKEAKATICEVLKRLAEVGIMSVDLLPSTNSLIPLFVLHHRWGKEGDYSFDKALRWFLLANQAGRYSDSATTSLNEDVRAIREAKCFREAVENLEKRLQISPITKEDFLSRYKRSDIPFPQLMLYLLLRKHQARDWVDETLIGYDKSGTPIRTGFEPQWHHIYPRSVLRKAGIADDYIHALANITVLNERTNVKKLAGKPPSDYIHRFRISEQTLRGHLIPETFARVVNDKALLEKQWDVERYMDFLNERAQLLAEEANAFLQKTE